MKRIMKKIVLFIVVLSASIQLHAQSKTFLGVELTAEATENSMRPGVGVTFEMVRNEQHGFETGIFLRNRQVDLSYYTNDYSYNRTSVVERYVSIPVIYKYYARLVNVSIGGSFDYYTGWSQKEASRATITSYGIEDKFNLGLIGKVGKSFKLSPDFMVEPELRASILTPLDEYYVGFGFIFKFKL